MSATILGLNGYTKKSTRKEYTQDTGLSTVVSYEGPIAKIDELLASSILSVQDGTIDKVTSGKSDGLGVLELSYADGDASQSDPNTVQNNTIWELVGQDLYKNLQSFDGAVSGSQAFNVDANQALLENARLYFETATKEGTIPTGEPYATYYKLLLRGVDQYVRSAAVLRSTINVSRRSLVAGRWVGVDRAWKLNSEDGSPDLDTVGQGAIIGSISEMPEADATKKQWLKRAPQITMASKRSYTITQEWWYARAWSANLYGGDLVP